MWRGNLHARFAPCQRSEASRIDRFFALWVWENIALKGRSAVCAIPTQLIRPYIKSHRLEILLRRFCVHSIHSRHKFKVGSTNDKASSRRAEGVCFIKMAKISLSRGAMTFAKSEGGRTGLTCGVRTEKFDSDSSRPLRFSFFQRVLSWPVCSAPRTFNRDIFWDYDANGNKKWNLIGRKLVFEFFWSDSAGIFTVALSACVQFANFNRCVIFVSGVHDESHCWALWPSKYGFIISGSFFTGNWFRRPDQRSKSASLSLSLLQCNCKEV